MDFDAVATFLALLAVIAEVGAASSLLLLLWRRAGHQTGLPAVLLDGVAAHAIGLAGLVAAVSMAGSLYFSEVAHFTPCNLCWYQRICMYPLAALLLIAASRRDHGIRPYAAVLAGVGAVIATYHVLIERFPDLESSDVCDPTNPCTIRWVERFGYLTIPSMALSGFLAILVLLLVDRTGNPSH